MFAINRGQIENRIDPHFYLPLFIEVTKKIKTNAYSTLGDIVKFSNETTDFSEFENGLFEYLEIANVDLNSNSYITTTKLVNEAPSRAKKKTQRGDICISTTRPHRGAIVEIKHNNIIASTGFSIIREVDKSIDKQWLLYSLMSTPVLGQMLQRSSGGNYPAITEDELKKVVLPVLPKEKQYELLGNIDKALQERKRKLKQAEEILISFYDAISEQFKLNVNSNINLCFAIHLKQLDGVIDVKRYKNMDSEHTLLLGDVCDIVEKKVNVDSFGTTIIDWIRIDDLPNFPLDIEQVRTRQANDIEGSFFEVKENDILLARLGPTILNKKIVLVRELQRQTIASSEFLVLRCKEGYNPEAVMAILKTDYYKNLMYSYARGSTPSRYRLNREDAMKLPFPIIGDLQDDLAQKAVALRTQVKSMRELAEQEWQAAKVQFAKELLGE